METKKQIEEYVRGIVRKKLGLPKETPSNPMRVKTPPKKYLIQPHNYRRYFTFKRDTYNPTIPYSEKNHKSEHHYTKFYGCNIIVRKKLVEVINLWHDKQWRLIEANSIENIQERIQLILKSMEETTIKAMKKFIKINGGESDLKPIERRKPEIGIHGDDYIDKLDKSLIIHDTHFKKVYEEKLEFTDEASIKNYIGNRSLEDFSPDISNGLNLIMNTLREIDNRLCPVIKDLAYNMKTHISVMKNIDKGIIKLNKSVGRLAQTNLKRWI